MASCYRFVLIIAPACDLGKLQGPPRTKDKHSGPAEAPPVVLGALATLVDGDGYLLPIFEEAPPVLFSLSFVATSHSFDSSRGIVR